MKINKIIIPIIFLVLGIGLSYLNQRKNNQVKLISNEITQDQSQNTSFNIPSSSWKESESTLSAGINTSDFTNDKFTIYENQNITANKTKVQTGEEVKFSVSLINKGTTKKFFTHICFNHSQGVTFGCVLGVNLDPGEIWPITGNTIFTTPGTYAVWVSWSQDKTNFYRPQKPTTTWVTVQ